MNVAPNTLDRLRGPSIALLVLLSTAALTASAQVPTATPPVESSPDAFGPAYPSSVTVDVSGMGRRHLIRLADGILRLSLTNTRASAVDAQVSIDVQAHGSFRNFDRGTAHLLGSTRLDVEIPIAELGITPADLETPAILTFRVLTRQPSGEPIDGVVTSAYYLHQHRRAGVVFYDERTLLRRFKGGDLRGLFTDERGRDLFPKQTKIFAGYAAGEPDSWTPPPVLSAGLQTICVRWNYESRDHGAGERYYANAEPIAARGVKLTVSEWGKPDVTAYANADTGCLSLPLAGTPTTVTVFAEANIGVNDNIHIRAFGTEKAENDKIVRSWHYLFVPGDTPVYLHIPASKESTLMALGSFSAYRLDQLAPITRDEAKLDLIFTGESTNSDAKSTYANISSAQWDRKFIYGHEIGHWYGLNQDFDFEAGYSFESKILPCWSMGADPDPPSLWHLLRATEMNTAAFKEGLAHFFSTVVWNGTTWPKPIFRYYKDLPLLSLEGGIYEDLTAGDNRVDMVASSGDPNLLGGRRNWRDNMCWQDDSNRFSVELDWARFLMNIVSDGAWSTLPNDETSFVALMALVKHTYDHHYQPDIANDPHRYKFDIYRYLYEALLDGPLGQGDTLDHWESLAVLYGVRPLDPVP